MFSIDLTLRGSESQRVGAAMVTTLVPMLVSSTVTMFIMFSYR